MSVIIHPKFIKGNDHVDLWDMGPSRPLPPNAPVEPDKEKLKSHDLALAQIQYEDAFETYKTELRAYGAKKQEFADWHKRNGGPVKVEMWSTDAVHALTIDADRYCLELPKGVKPGQAQLDSDRRAEQAERDMDEARASDPQFGKGNKR